LSDRYPMLLIPMPDKPGGPSGAQRMRSALKVLRRVFRIRAKWIASDITTTPVSNGQQAGQRRTIR